MTAHYILARTLIKSTPGTCSRNTEKEQTTALHSRTFRYFLAQPTANNLHHGNTLTRTPAPTCSQTYSTHTPCTLHPFLKHHVSRHSSFVHTAAVKNESSTSKLCTNLPSLWVNGLVQANNSASPPCHFVLSTPSNYKFFQEMARVFHPLLQARGNFTLIHFHAPQPHTEVRGVRKAIRHGFPRTVPVMWVLKSSVPLCSQVRSETSNANFLYNNCSFSWC
jgi:hypothetical protein